MITSPVDTNDVNAIINNDNDSDEEEILPPDEFICPLTLDIMMDPVVDRNGHNFERVAIMAWIYRGNMACPLTRGELLPSYLTRNVTLQQQIDDWKRKHNWKNENHHYHYYNDDNEYDNFIMRNLFGIDDDELHYNIPATTTTTTTTAAAAAMESENYNNNRRGLWNPLRTSQMPTPPSPTTTTGDSRRLPHTARIPSPFGGYYNSNSSSSSSSSSASSSATMMPSTGMDIARAVAVVSSLSSRQRKIIRVVCNFNIGRLTRKSRNNNNSTRSHNSRHYRH